MSWKNQLQRAKFRGAVFGVVDSETTIGRRTILHEYPLRDEAYAEDMGKKGREFTVNAFVIGDNYIAARNALVSAVESSGSGTLVHPTLGSMTVCCISSRLHFKNTEGGIEYFELKFVEAGSNKNPSSARNTSYISAATSSASLKSFVTSFSQVFSAKNFSDFVAYGAANMLLGTGQGASGQVVPKTSSLVGVLTTILQKRPISNTTLKLGVIPIGDAPAQDPTASINYSAMVASLNTFTANAVALVTTLAPAPVATVTGGIANDPQPLPLATSITNLISQLTQIYPNDPATAILSQAELHKNFGSDLPYIPLTTTQRMQEAINQQQLIDLVRNASLAEMVRATSVMTWASRDDAFGTMATIEALLEPQLLYLANAGFDSAYTALNNVRVAMIQDITARASTLKIVKYVKINDPLPALVFAYKQYQDATLEADVIARNKVRNPVLIPPLSNLEVLV